MRYTDLLVVPSVDEIYNRMKESARARGADPDAWTAIDIPALFLWCVAVLFNSIYTLLAYFAKGAVFDATSDPDMADVYGKSEFGLTRLAATAAVFEIELVNESGNTYDLTAGTFTLRTSTNRRYILQSDVLLAPGSTSGTFKAEEAGLRGNVDPLSINVFETPLAGARTGDTCALTTPGTDKETVAAYVFRCQALFDGLGAGHSGFVAKLALALDATLTKVKTRVDSSTSGELIIYLGTVAGPASDEQCDDFVTLIQQLDVFQAIDVSVLPAEIETIVIEGNVVVLPGQLDAATAAIEEAVSKWQAVVGFGGTIRESDYWRLPLGLTADNQKISGIFSSNAIDSVDFETDTSYSVDQWKMIVFQNDLVIEEP